MTWKFPRGVTGWLSEDEGKALSELARGRVVLEIGAYHGRSTISMAQTASHVFTVDWGWGDSAVKCEDSCIPTLLNNLRGYKVSDKVSVLVGRGMNVLPVLKNNRFDLIFVDGNHDTDAVRNDLIHANHLLAFNGVIALHDWGYFSVREAARQVLGWDNDTPGHHRVDSLYFNKLER